MISSLRIAMVTGSYPPDACGVGGYTARLVQELSFHGHDVHVLKNGPWGIVDVPRLNREISLINPDIVHIQYPTVGFNRSLGPQGLSLCHPNVVVTVHEVSQVHVLRRLSLYPFSLRSKALFFSNQFDRDYATAFAPWISSKTHIIPLGSSIPQNSEPEVTNDPQDVVCFGLIRPQKGLEDFIEAAAESKRQGLPFVFTFVGMKDPRFEDYYWNLKKLSEDLPIRWEMDLDDQAVAKRLAKATFAYMPYPDGATERRTSMIAMLAQGIAVLTTASEMTPDLFKNNLSIAADPKSAVQIIKTLSHHPVQLAEQVRKGVEVAKKFDWPAIAERHIEIYKSIKLLHA